MKFDKQTVVPVVIALVVGYYLGASHEEPKPVKSEVKEEIKPASASAIIFPEDCTDKTLLEWTQRADKATDIHPIDRKYAEVYGLENCSKENLKGLSLDKILTKAKAKDNQLVEPYNPENQWYLQESNSKMTDDKTVTVILVPDNTIDTYMKKIEPKLIIRCKEKQTDVFISGTGSANPEYGSYDKYTVRLRFDNEKPYQEYWSQGTENDSLFASNPVKLAKKIAHGQNFKFEYTPFNSPNQVIEYNIKGFDKYIGKVSSTCGWNSAAE